MIGLTKFWCFEISSLLGLIHLSFTLLFNLLLGWNGCGSILQLS